MRRIEPFCRCGRKGKPSKRSRKNLAAKIMRNPEAYSKKSDRHTKRLPAKITDLGKRRSFSNTYCFLVGVIFMPKNRERLF